MARQAESKNTRTNSRSTKSSTRACSSKMECGSDSAKSANTRKASKHSK